MDKKNVDMLTGQKVFSEVELKSRLEITLDNYCKTVLIEANTMTDMVKKQIAPAIMHYSTDVASAAAGKQSLLPGLSCSYEKKLVGKLSVITDQIEIKTEELEDAMLKVREEADVVTESCGIRDKVLPLMGELRALCDEAETLGRKRILAASVLRRSSVRRKIKTYI